VSVERHSSSCPHERGGFENGRFENWWRCGPPRPGAAEQNRRAIAELDRGQLRSHDRVAFGIRD
jgi:hypothetical protein